MQNHLPRFCPSPSATALIVALAMALTACGQSDNDTATPASAAPSSASEAALQMPAEAQRAVQDANNLSAPVPVMDLDPLLTPEDASRITGLPSEQAQRNRLSKPINSLHYAWKSSRKRELPSGLKLPVEDAVQLFQPAVRVRTSEAIFRKQHLQEADPAAVERALQGLRGSKRYQAMAQDQQQMAERMLLGAIKRPPMIEVGGIGQVAAWDGPSNTLYVLNDGYVFAAMADLSNDSEKNRDVAVALARQALDRL